MSNIPNRTPGDYLRLVEAAAALTVAKLAILLLPFRTVVRTASWRSPIGPEPSRLQAAKDVAVATERAARYLPWRCVCFDKGLALHWMLRRRRLPSRLHYGVGSGEERLTAHVWVSLGGQILVGEEQAGRHAVVATFPADMS